jgi:hypothetical protein
VTVLSLVAFAASPGLVILMADFFFNIYSKFESPSFGQDPLGSLWLCLFVLLASGSFLTLAWISYTAGLDLWKLKKRGRKLAYISMTLYSLFGIVYLLFRETWSTKLGLGICALSVFFLIYLQLPSIRQKFDSPSPGVPS